MPEAAPRYLLSFEKRSPANARGTAIAAVMHIIPIMVLDAEDEQVDGGPRGIVDGGEHQEGHGGRIRQDREQDR